MTSPFTLTPRGRGQGEGQGRRHVIFRSSLGTACHCHSTNVPPRFVETSSTTRSGFASPRRRRRMALPSSIAEWPRGGLEAGRMVAEICLAGLGSVEFVPTPGGSDSGLAPGLSVAVRTERPVAACLASQYAGWKVQHGKFFAMGSGPMRAAIGKEPLYDKIGLRERPAVAIGVLETAKLSAGGSSSETGRGLRHSSQRANGVGHPHCQPGRHGANRGSDGGDGDAQIDGTRFRPQPN